MFTAKVPGRRAKVIAKVARQRNKGRLEDQAERQLEAEFNVLRQARERGMRVCVSPIHCNRCFRSARKELVRFPPLIAQGGGVCVCGYVWLINSGHLSWIVWLCVRASACVSVCVSRDVFVTSTA